MFARSVVENKVSGLVYVDNVDNPKTFYVVHPYGISLLFGDCNNELFNSEFKKYALNTNKVRNKQEWMQASSNSWDRVLNKLFHDCLSKPSEIDDGSKTIELHTRINFNFNRDKYLKFKQENSSSNYKIIRTDKKMFAEMKGSVIPSLFWNNADDFIEKGLGFSLYYKNKLAAIAFSSFIHDNKFELGIETIEAYRGMGFAQQVCSAVIDYCLENNYEPIWACRLGNIGSYKLAQKLGFEPVKKIPFYKLCD